MTAGAGTRQQVGNNGEPRNTSQVLFLLNQAGSLVQSMHSSHYIKFTI